MKNLRLRAHGNKTERPRPSRQANGGLAATRVQSASRNGVVLMGSIVVLAFWVRMMVGLLEGEHFVVLGLDPLDETVSFCQRRRYPAGGVSEYFWGWFR